MTILNYFFRFLIAYLFLGIFINIIFYLTIFAQNKDVNEFSAYISEIEIKGTSELESSQIIFLIESQIGDILDRVNFYITKSP